MKLILNITTEDGELLERVEVDVTDDPLYPIGNSAVRASYVAEIESAARIVRARQHRVIDGPADAKWYEERDRAWAADRAIVADMEEDGLL